MSARRLAVFTTAFLLALGAWLAGPSLALAHNVLRSTSPGDNATVDRVPSAVVLTFDEPALGMGTAMAVTGPDGQVQQGPAELVDNTVRQPIRPGAPAGGYTVKWRVTSVDGHPISGTFSFTARRAGVESPSAATSPSGPATATPGATAASSSTSTAATDGEQSGSEQSSGGTPAVWLWIAVAALLVVAGIASAVVRRRRSSRS